MSLRNLEVCCAIRRRPQVMAKRRLLAEFGLFTAYVAYATPENKMLQTLCLHILDGMPFLEVLDSDSDSDS